MNKLPSALAITLCGLLALAACKKKDVNLGAKPIVTLKTGAAYPAQNDTLHVGDTMTLGVTASADGNPDKLATMVIRRSLNNGDFTTIKDVSIPADQKENYSGDFKVILQTAGKQVYKFIVVNTHGVEGDAVLNLTVVP